MRKRWIKAGGSALLVLMISCGGVAAQAAPAKAPKKEEAPEERKPFAVEDVIHPIVAAMPTPEFREDIISLPMAISARSEAAQKHVLQGMAYIHAAWDFEAYRHFCEAARLDPNCMMAYFGIGLSLAAPNNEFAQQRMAAVDRMLDLVDATVGTPPQRLGTPIEREYCLSLAVLFTANASAASKAFKRLADRYPNNLQARLLGTYLQRDGYTEFGEALYGQEVAIEEMEKILVQYPDNLAVLTFLAMLYAEAPDAVVTLRDEVLPLVRKIVSMVPDFAPYQHLLGHYEWRCGNHGLAEKALGRAVDLYAAHMKKSNTSYYNCDAWVRCQVYLATALHSRGKFPEAMKIALDVAALQVDEKRLGSAGANLVIWEARTLPARLYAARGWDQDFKRGIDSFPGKDDPQLFMDRTLSIFYLEALRQYLGARQKLAEGNIEEARQYREAMSATGNRLLELQKAALNSSSISEYLRALRTLEVLTVELRGLIALGGDDDQRRLSFDWFRSATDKQARPTLLMPPAIVYPMEIRVADYFMRTGEFTRAAQAYKDGLKRYPNNLATLRGYQQALLRLDRKGDAAKIAKQIELVSEQ